MNPIDRLFDLYAAFVLRAPLVVLALVALLTAGLGLFIGNFRLDASADSLVVEGDPDLAFSREISERFGTRDFVFIAYTPDAELFSAPVLRDLEQLRDELLDMERIESVDSILTVPLFEVAGATLTDVADNIVTLEDPGVDPRAAREDLLGNEAYLDVLISRDGTTTALIANFAVNEPLREVTDARYELRRKARETGLSAAERAELEGLEERYVQLRREDGRNLRQDIAEMRRILRTHEDSATVHMGGVPMIADDLITFVRSDLVTFGLAVLVFIIAALWFFFRNLRFVILPVLCGATITLAMTGLLGLLNWPVTVISSNFVSLLLIITVSLTVHLTVRYRELQLEQPESGNLPRLRRALGDMIVPCAYTSLTTIVAFGSLVISDIPPVVDFGLMMVLGVSFAFVLSFLLFPALMALLPEPAPPRTGQRFDITPAIGRFTERHGKAILVSALILFIACVVGVSRLQIENSFIDYFDEDTQIYQGMLTIDRKMGGTTPLEVIVTMTPPAEAGEEEDAAGNEWDDEAWFEDEGEESDAYWFTSDKMDRIMAIHDYLDSLEETGKVLSLATLLGIAYELNDNRKLDSFELGILYNRIPEEYKETLIKPYVSVEHDQARFSVRVRESDPDLKRDELLRQIRVGLQENFDLEPEQVDLTGMLVLYNNMLQSLYGSQILTIAVVMAAIGLMFIVLFRSVPLALLGLAPNVLAALSVLGLMGLLNIPLDMMTITIAAIVIGIGVDNTIHYIHRFRTNFPRLGSYRETMHYCHGSIGKAMYYTSFTIIAGFSLLVLSNFVPTVYFGLLTSLAMLLALAGALTLLPRLLLWAKPLGEP